MFLTEVKARRVGRSKAKSIEEKKKDVQAKRSTVATIIKMKMPLWRFLWIKSWHCYGATHSFWSKPCRSCTKGWPEGNQQATVIHTGPVSSNIEMLKGKRKRSCIKALERARSRLRCFSGDNVVQVCSFLTGCLLTFVINRYSSHWQNFEESKRREIAGWKTDDLSITSSKLMLPVSFTRFMRCWIPKLLWNRSYHACRFQQRVYNHLGKRDKMAGKYLVKDLSLP